MVTVSAPGFSAKVTPANGETVKTLVQRAAKTVKGATVPRKPVYMLGGKRVDPKTPVPKGAQRVTVATQAKNG